MATQNSVNNTITGTATTSTGTNALYSATTTVNVSSATAPTTGQVLTATGASAATWQDAAGGGTWTLIDSAIVSGTSTLIDSTSIASGYDMIKIKIGVRDNSNNWVRMTLNNDSGSTSYRNQTLTVASTTVTGALADAAYIDLSVGEIPANDGFVCEVIMSRDENDVWRIKSSGSRGYDVSIRDCAAYWGNGGATELDQITIVGTASFNYGAVTIEGINLT